MNREYDRNGHRKPTRWYEWQIGPYRSHTTGGLIVHTLIAVVVLSLCQLWAWLAS